MCPKQNVFFLITFWKMDKVREGVTLVILRKMRKESDGVTLNSDLGSRGDKRAHGPLSTLLSDRIPLYCNVDKLTTC
jgi:hypothetical protein